MSGTRVVHVNDRVEGAVYIGRAMPRQGLKASPFRNPFRPRDGDAIELFITYLNDPNRGRPLLAQLPELRGKPLACWCIHHGDPAPIPPDADPDDFRCHGEVLKFLLDNLTDEELRTAAAGTDVRACRECGCTDDHACEGGCWWVSYDLCSACVGEVES